MWCRKYVVPRVAMTKVAVLATPRLSSSCGADTWRSFILRRRIPQQLKTVKKVTDGLLLVNY